MGLILDTNAVSALLAGDSALEELLSDEKVHHLPAIVLGEYWYGLAQSKHRLRLGRLLELLIDESNVLLIDTDTARHYAMVRDHLRSVGHPIPENDVWIAALARQHGLKIVTRDAHFDAVDPALRRAW